VLSLLLFPHIFVITTKSIELIVTKTITMDMDECGDYYYYYDFIIIIIIIWLLLSLVGDGSNSKGKNDHSDNGVKVIVIKMITTIINTLRITIMITKLSW